MPHRKVAKRITTTFKKDIKSAQAEVLAVLKKMEVAARKSGDMALVLACVQEKKKVNARFKDLLKRATDTQTDFKNELKRSAAAHKKMIDALEHVKEAAASDNILLEYKKKDLQQKANELENAYDELSDRNKELLAQKQLIDKQTHEILEKNRELEAKTESLLDQADYLHEANEAITNMHKRLESQQEEILSKNEELLSLNTEKNNLIGIVAHDLKSPLNQIKGLVSIIKITAPSIDGEALDCLQMIESSANRLSGMIGKILDIEAIESKQLNLMLEDIDFSQVVNTVVDRYQNDASQKQITLNRSITDSVLIAADRSYIDQVIENLLSNAIKFSPSGKRICIHLTLADGKAQCEIRDEGPGLSEDDMKKVFSKYQKLSAKPTGNESSTGLGLSIVKKFVEAMHGEIWCESEAGKGASFFVRFNKSTT